MKEVSGDYVQEAFLQVQECQPGTSACGAAEGRDASLYRDAPRPEVNECTVARFAQCLEDSDEPSGLWSLPEWEDLDPWLEPPVWCG